MPSRFGKYFDFINGTVYNDRKMSDGLCKIAEYLTEFGDFWWNDST